MINVDLLIKCLQVLNEDIVKCHVHSHMSSLVGSTKQTDPETRSAKVRALFPKLANNITLPFVNF